MHIFSDFIINFTLTYILAKSYKGKPGNYTDRKKAVKGFLAFCFMGFILVIAGVISFVKGAYLAVLVMLGGIFAIAYIVTLSPWIQNAENYRFEGDSPEDLRVFYKGKEVLIDYIINEDGTIDFEDNTRKHKAIHWADGSHMSERKAYLILNFFSMYMSDYLSEDASAIRFER